MPTSHIARTEAALPAEEHLASSSYGALWARLTEHIVEAVMVIDRDGAILFANQRTTELTGFDRAELVGRNACALLRDPSEGVSRLEAVRAGKTVPATAEFEVIRKDGTVAWAELSFEPIRLGGHLIGLLGIARDITARRRALQVTRVQAAALEAAANAIVITDSDGEIVWVNSAFSRLTGYEAEDAIGKTPRILCSQQHPPSFYGELWRTIRSGAVWHGEIVNRRKTGELYTEEQTITPVRNDRDEITHFVAIKQDATERREIQDRLIQSEKLATLGELVAGIAHELNNPLAVLAGHAELLRMQQTDPKLQKKAEQMISAAQRATRVVKNFLTIARRGDHEHKRVIVRDVVREALDILAYQLRMSNVTVTADLPATVPVVIGDDNQLTQVLLNLCSNAMHAMRLAGRSGNLSVSVVPGDDDRIRVHVSDDGPGIAPEHLTKIFEPFFTTKPAGLGTGLGLTLSMAIARSHGGDLTVASEFGHGATFTLELPIGGAPADMKPAPVTRQLPRGLRVLAVDDELPILSLLEEAFGRQGVTVMTTPGGPEVFDILESTPVDVVVLDFKMPNMSGGELWERIHERWPELARRVVFCTGSVVSDETRAFLKSTGCVTVLKPFDLTTLFDAVACSAELRRG